MANARIEEEEYVGPALSKHDWQYIGVGFGLAVITAVEVVLYSVEKSGNISPAVNTWSLLILSFVKFIIVAGFFMHLKTDNPLFKRMFVVGATLAGFAYLAMLTAFGVFRTWVPWVAYAGFAIVAVVLAMRRSGAADAHHDHDDHDHAGHDLAGHDLAGHDLAGHDKAGRDKSDSLAGAVH